MSITGIGNNPYSYLDVGSASGVISASGVSAGSSLGPSAVDSDGDNDGSGAKVSGYGQFMQKLQALEKSNPQEASQVLSQIADKLHAQAQGGDANAQQLSALGDKFQQAAQTGDLSALAPQGHHGGHHHHHHAGGTSSSTSGAAGAQQAYAATANGSSGTSLLDIFNQAYDSVTGASGATATAQ